MSLKIRLARGGAKKRPFYRIVVADARMPRDGRFIERLGTFDPLKAKDAADRIVVDAEKAADWITKGAQPTDRVARILETVGVGKREAAQQSGERPAEEEGAGARRRPGRRCREGGRCRRRAGRRSRVILAVTGRIAANRILVGRFGAPHGVRGEVRLQSFTQDPLAIGSYGPLAGSNGRLFTLKSVRLVKDNMLVVRVEGVADRTGAEALTHIDLSLDRSALPPPDEDEFYITDLVGLDAVDTAGEKLGSVIGVPNYGGGDLVEVRPIAGGESLLFPFTRAVVPEIDIAGHRVVIAPPDEVEAEDEPR